jgi:phosphosulfolactate phosphohydrolase-like enzyme
MILKRATLGDRHKETDTAIAIDVLRAFTASAFHFPRGAHEIALVSTVDDVFRLKARFPHALIMGENRGHPLLHRFYKCL